MPNKNHFAILFLIGILFLLAACSPGLDAIDRRLERVIGTSATGANLKVQPRLIPATPTIRDADRYSTHPATVNPDADSLPFEPLVRAAPGTPQAIDALNSRLRNYAANAGGVGQDDVLDLDLARALGYAQEHGRQYRTAEEEYLFSAINLLIEQHRWGPRLFNDTSVTASGSGSQGRFDTAVDVINTLRTTQRLPYGGQVEARWVWNAAEQLRSSVTGQYRQSSALVLDANIPLLRGSGMVARESIIQSQRNLVYAARSFELFRRSYFVSIATDYFRLLQTISNLQNRVEQFKSLQIFVAQEEAKYDAGRRSEFEVNIARNQLLSTTSSLASSREQYTLQVDRFKIRLGIPVQQPIRLVGATFDISDPSTDVEAASTAALTYRLDLQNQIDQLIDARRGIEIARDQLRPDLNLNSNVRVPTDPLASEGGVDFDFDETSWQVGLILSLPLDRRIERLQLRQAIIRLERQKRNYDQFLDNVVLDVRRRVREIDLARFRLELADAQVRINERRLEEQEIKADTITTQQRLDTENELLNARNARDAAMTDLRIAVLNYLDAAGLLRVSPQGMILPLPGMNLHIENTPINFDAIFMDPQMSEEEKDAIDATDATDATGTNP